METESKRLPHFNSIDELVEFFEDNDLGDYLDGMSEVAFGVNIRRGYNRIEREEALSMETKTLTLQLPSQVYDEIGRASCRERV